MNVDAKACYKIDLQGRYADIQVPPSDWLNKVEEHQEVEVKGIVGKGTPKGNVVVESIYGSIKLSSY